jgi:hypothetical protein
MTATVEDTPEHELLRDQIARLNAKEVEPHRANGPAQALLNTNQ